MLSLLLLSVLPLLGGCLPYPIYKTLQPAAQIKVQDISGHPLAGAKVTLIATAYPYGREKSRETQVTDANGIAKFIGRSEWRAETLMIHGAEEYVWRWCVEKEGYETVKGEDVAKGGVVLRMGESSPCGK